MKHKKIQIFLCAGPSKSKSAPSDDEMDVDSEDDDDDVESGKEQKKKNFDISAPGTRMYLFPNYHSVYHRRRVCQALEIFSSVFKKFCILN